MQPVGRPGNPFGIDLGALFGPLFGAPGVPGAAYGEGMGLQQILQYLAEHDPKY